MSYVAHHKSNCNCEGEKFPCRFYLGNFRRTGTPFCATECETAHSRSFCHELQDIAQRGECVLNASCKTYLSEQSGCAFWHDRDEELLAKYLNDKPAEPRLAKKTASRKGTKKGAAKSASANESVEPSAASKFTGPKKDRVRAAAASAAEAAGELDIVSAIAAQALESTSLESLTGAASTSMDEDEACSLSPPSDDEEEDSPTLADAPRYHGDGTVTISKHEYDELCKAKRILEKIQADTSAARRAKLEKSKQTLMTPQERDALFAQQVASVKEANAARSRQPRQHRQPSPVQFQQVPVYQHVAHVPYDPYGQPIYQQAAPVQYGQPVYQQAAPVQYGQPIYQKAPAPRKPKYVAREY